ncbi:hypothetical protein [Fulvivirga sp.]|uniref:hypothetical protein n=2 Tax=Fulvivirga sp. TaxID=1931237 RepID=UPI0032EB660F
MALQAEKEYIKSELDKIEDIHLVEAIRNMLDFGKAKRYERSLFPMTRESFYERNALSRKAIEEDQLLTQKEAQAYFAKKHAK